MSQRPKDEIQIEIEKQSEINKNQDDVHKSGEIRIKKRNERDIPAWI